LNASATSASPNARVVSLRMKSFMRATAAASTAPMSAPNTAAATTAIMKGTPKLTVSTAER
jgi:hypothetical protein